jgi:hypothetical protein
VQASEAALLVGAGSFVTASPSLPIRKRCCFMNADPELSSVAEILIAMKKLPDAELLDLLAAVEKEAEKRNLR